MISPRTPRHQYFSVSVVLGKSKISRPFGNPRFRGISDIPQKILEIRYTSPRKVVFRAKCTAIKPIASIPLYVRLSQSCANQGFESQYFYFQVRLPGAAQCACTCLRAADSADLNLFCPRNRRNNRFWSVSTVDLSRIPLIHRRIAAELLVFGRGFLRGILVFFPRISGARDSQGVCWIPGINDNPNSITLS